jgi:RNA recognition motif-containing protein
MATEDARKLFVAGLPESISEDVLRQLFEATGGKVVEVSLPRERATGKVRGFGFVTFATADEAMHARDELDGSMQAGRSISVRPFSSEPPKRGERSERGEVRSEMPGPGPGAEDRTLYVGNLPYDTSQQELTQFLNDNGVASVARIHLPIGPDGRMRGFGFVTLGSGEAAQEALNSLRTAELRGRRLMINVAHPRSAGPGPGPGMGGPRPSFGGGPPRYPTEPPMSFEGGASPPPPRAPRPGGAEGGPDWADKKKKKGKTTGREGKVDDRKRAGSSNWQSRVDWDDDD